MQFNTYQTDGFYDELFRSDETLRDEFRLFIERIDSLPQGELTRTQQAAEHHLINMGITFNVYGDKQGRERILPFDLIPRILTAEEWQWMEKGLQQRIQALNLFINDIYHKQKIVKDKVIPREVIQSSQGFREACVGINPPKNVWAHINGTDIVRVNRGQFFVLEDNMRVPSGVSYVLQNRSVLKQTFPEVFKGLRIRPVDDYPGRLLAMLQDLAPTHNNKPEVVLLTPGPYNSAYFEHSFLAQQMGIELVEGKDLTTVDDHVFMQTTSGLEHVDVIYRRIDDEFLDPEVFMPESLIGVPGLMSAYRKGNVNIVNAPGTGIADDKFIYTYVPEMTRYYLDQDIMIPNVPTYRCIEEKEMNHVLDNIEKLVVKPVNASGGYGMMVGPQASQKERNEFKAKIQQNPRNYIAQPTLPLSRVPTLVNGNIEGRHVDLRPFSLYGKDIFVLPGGLTRVALRKGSLVVNSSQGGGSKDTWVLS